MKKYVAEFIGTGVLVTFGCGTAMLVGCDAAGGCGYLLTALAFGVVMMLMVYCLGDISGCHINPAVSLAVMLQRKITFKEFMLRSAAQCLGAGVGIALLAAVFILGDIEDQTGAFGSNSVANLNENMIAVLLVEMILTFVFVFIVLKATDEDFAFKAGAGVIIGGALLLVHIMGIGMTGTSVNPARSIAPAVAAAIAGNSAPLAALWGFIVGPLAGGALAALAAKGMKKPSGEDADQGKKHESENNKARKNESMKKRLEAFRKKLSGKNKKEIVVPWMDGDAGAEKKGNPETQSTEERSRSAGADTKVTEAKAQAAETEKQGVEKGTKVAEAGVQDIEAENRGIEEQDKGTHGIGKNDQLQGDKTVNAATSEADELDPAAEASRLWEMLDKIYAEEANNEELERKVQKIRAQLEKTYAQDNNRK